MKKTIDMMCAATLVLAMTACSNEGGEAYTANAPVAAQVTAGINSLATRASGSVWEADEIGVMAIAVSGTTEGITSTMTTLYQNVYYRTSQTTADGATFLPQDGSLAHGIFFQDAAETVTFAAYGPYQASNAAGMLPGASGVIAVSTAAQSSRAAQRAFDFIFAQGATASKQQPTVVFTGASAFSHAMTRLNIQLRTSDTDGFEASEVLSGSYTLSGIQHEGTFCVNPADNSFGQAVASAQPAGTAGWSLNDNALRTEQGNMVTFDAILLPQTVASLEFEAVISSQSYRCTITPALQAGKAYTYTITARKQGLTVEGCTVSDWVTGTTENNGEIDAR